MLKRLLVCLTAVTLMASVETARAAEGDYFPLTVGTQWVYGGNPREVALSVQVYEVIKTTEGPGYVWDGFMGKRIMRETADGKVMELRGQTWRMVLDLNAEAGASWTVDAVDGAPDVLDGSVVTVVSRSEAIKVPYGAFENALHLAVKPNPQLADAGIGDLWFAPGVGLVKWTETTIAGPQTYELARFSASGSADAGGGTTPAPPDSATVDPPVVTGPLPPVYADYFPMKDGLIWAYLGGPANAVREVTMKADPREAGPVARLFIWDGLQGERHIYRDADGKVHELRDEGERLLFDLNAEVGASWTIEGKSGDVLDGSVVTVVSRSEAIKVPYGAFENALHLGVKPNPQLADAGVEDLWFAPGVGLIKWTETTIAGPQTYELAKFDSSAPQPVPVPGDSTIAIDPTDPKHPLESYENRTSQDRNGVRYELGTVQAAYVQGDNIEMQYRVTALDQETTFHFNSTQHYDFRLDNDLGKTVWSWSATRLFGYVMTELTLAPGKSASFVAFLNLDVDALPGGTYTLLGWMPTDTGSEETYVKVPVTITGDPAIASLTGTVLDENGSPVPDAWVGLSLIGNTGVVGYGGASGATSAGSPDPSSTGNTGVVESKGDLVAVSPSFAAPTSRSGLFTLNRLKPGTYGLTVRADGYHLYAQNIEIGTGENRVEVRLKALKKDGYPNLNGVRGNRFVAELATDRDHYAPGDSVQVRYRLTNVSDAPVTLTFPTGQEYDLALDGSTGRMWTWSMGKMFSMDFRTRTLAPGETYAFETMFTLNQAGVKDNPSFLLTGVLAVDAQADGQADRKETEAYVKFAIDGWVMPNPDSTETTDADTIQAPAGMVKRAGDFDGDGRVNFGDFLHFAAAYGKASGMDGFDASMDMDGNGKVDFSDFLNFASVFGR